MNNPQKNYNALLLEVMAHDLMAPLTAIKWQIELLGKSYKDKEKREKYLKGLAESTELGITIGKYAHITGKILGGSYEGYIGKAKISKVIYEAVADLRLQYERHALGLRMDNLEQPDREKDFDIQLTELYVWCIAKFFLAAATPKSEVVMTGLLEEREGKFTYLFTVSSREVVNPEASVACIQEGVDHELNQLSLFSRLIRASGELLHISEEAQVRDGVFSITSCFEL